MESVLDMLRPLHFVFVLAAFAFLAFASAKEAEGVIPAANVQSEIEGSPDANVNDLEADASYWGGGYYRPYGRYGGYGRGYGGGYGGYGGWRGYGWGRPFYGRNLGYWG